MTNQLFPTPPRAFDRNGEPLAAAKAYVYQTGTMTAVTVTDSAGTPLAWPVIADANGTFAQMFYAGVYTLKLIITDSDGTIQPGYPMDPVAMATAGANSAINITFTPTVEAPSINVQGGMEELSSAIGGLRSTTISAAGLATGGGSLAANRTITVTAATADQARAGTDSATVMTPQRTAQAIDARVYTSNDQTITSGDLLTLAHGLLEAPWMVSLSLICQTGEENWSAGQEVFIGTNHSSSVDNRFNSVYADATNVHVRFSDLANCFLAGNRTTGVVATLTNANWKLRVRAVA